MVNERRDVVLGIRSYNTHFPITPDQACVVLWNDYLPIMTAIIVMLFFASIILYFLPLFVTYDRPDIIRQIGLIRWLCAIVPVIGLVITFAAGVSDWNKMESHIKKMPDQKCFQMEK